MSTAEAIRNYEFVDQRHGYNIYRAIVDGKGRWRAVKVDGRTGREIGEPFRISYDQALGLAPIDEVQALGMYLGRLLLPRYGRA